jgi:hypothetical protein
LFEAFKNAYRLSAGNAREMLKESVDIIHVYGDIGALPELDPDEPSARPYGFHLKHDDYTKASKRILIIERADESAEFRMAREKIETATFVGILGFGYDQTNVRNLDLPKVTNEKRAFSTGFKLGYGMRAWIRDVGLGDVFIGREGDDVKAFLHNSGFLQWANTPGKTPLAMQASIARYFENKNLREYN